MAMTILLGGIDKTQQLQPNSVRYNDTINARNTAKFRLKDTEAALSKQEGAEVIFYDGTILYEDIVLSDRPVGYWRLDELTGATTAKERQGLSGGDAVIAGTPIFGVSNPNIGDSNTAITFDGTDDECNISTVPARLNIASAITISLWLKRDAVQAVNAGLVGFEAASYLLEFRTDNTVRFYINNASNFVASAAIADDNWHHVLATWDGTTGANGMEIFVDGVSSGTATSTESTIAGHTSTFYLGRSSVASTFWKGNLDEVAVYNKVFTSARALIQFNAAGGSGTRLFAGMAVEPIEKISKGLNIRTISYRVAGYEQILDNILIPRVYENKTTEFIVADVLAQDLIDTGITTGTIDAGVTVIKVVFNYQAVSASYTELSDLSGQAWWIDTAKRLQFRSRAGITAPTVLTQLNCLTAELRTSRQLYRNVQLLRAGKDLTNSRPEVQVGDGELRAFQMTFPVGKVPSLVEENRGGGGYVSKTIGVHQVATGKDWYWNRGSTGIVQDDGGTVLADQVDLLRVTYQGEFPIVVEDRDDIEITARRTAEGGTGLYTRIVNRPHIDDQDVALNTSTALIARHRIKQIGTMVTDVTGYEAGQLITLNMPKLNLNSVTYLIEQVAARDLKGKKLRFTLTVLEGDPSGGWQEVFRQWIAGATSGQQIVIRENEVLILLRSSIDPVTCTDALVVASAAPESRVGFALVGFSEVG